MAEMSIQRLIDANLNRAAEAIRLLEDLARFVIEDAGCAETCKAARHDVHIAGEAIWPDMARAWHRDTAGDLGTQLSVPTETDRSSMRDLAVAAGARAAQALRALEEVAKLECGHTNKDLEAIRYRMYDAAAAIERRLGSTMVQQWPVCLLLTMSSCLRPWSEVLEAALDAGIRCIQVREKDLSDRDLVEHIHAVRRHTVPYEATVIVNDRVDVALATEADGVHLGQNDLALLDARRLCAHRLIVGISTHTVNEVLDAVKLGADYIGIGPIHQSPTKPDLIPAGEELITQTLPCAGQMPHLVIGGLTPESISQMQPIGVQGVAVGAAICGASDPGATSHACLEAIQSPREELVQRD